MSIVQRASPPGGFAADLPAGGEVKLPFIDASGIRPTGTPDWSVGVAGALGRIQEVHLAGQDGNLQPVLRRR